MKITNFSKYIKETTFEPNVELTIDISIRELLDCSNEQIGEEIRKSITDELYDNK